MQDERITTRIGVLGSLIVSSPDGDTPIPGGMTSTLLEWLVAHRASGVTVDATVTALWPSAPPPEARSVLRGYLSRLRRSLPENEIIVRTPNDRLVLDLAAVEVDVDEFQVDLAEGTAHLADGRPEVALEYLDRALARWRGDAFPSLWDTATGVAESTHLAAARTDAEVARCAAWIATGRPGRAVSALVDVVNRDATQEVAWRLLMLGSAVSGNRAEASRVFQRCRRELASRDQRPGPETIALDHRVLEGGQLDAGPLVQHEYADQRHDRLPARFQRYRETSGPRVVVAVVADQTTSVTEHVAALAGSDPIILGLAPAATPDDGPLEPLASALEAADLADAEEGLADTARRLRSWPQADDLPSSAVRIRCLTALADTVRAATRSRPLAIVVAASVATTPVMVSVLRHLTDNVGSCPLLVVFTTNAASAGRLITATDDIVDLR